MGDLIVQDVPPGTSPALLGMCRMVRPPRYPYLQINSLMGDLKPALLQIPHEGVNFAKYLIPTRDFNITSPPCQVFYRPDNPKCYRHFMKTLLY